jgi:hypothetical protein
MTAGDVECVRGVETFEEADETEPATGDVQMVLELEEGGGGGYVDGERVGGHEVSDENGVRCEDHECGLEESHGSFKAGYRQLAKEAAWMNYDGSDVRVSDMLSINSGYNT